MVIKWTNPPPRNPVSKWKIIGRELKAKPDKWALIAEAGDRSKAQVIVSRLRNRRTAPLGPGQFEVEYDDDGNVYARYLEQ